MGLWWKWDKSTMSNELRECDGMKCEYAVSDQAKARMRTQIKFMTRLFDYPKKRLLNQADLLECEGIPTRKKKQHIQQQQQQQ